VETTATVLIDSIVNGIRVTTFEVLFPRIILAEVNTHRVFSRNYQSSRALPTARQREMASFTPKIWRMNNPGMQPKNNADEITSKKAELIWNMARKSAMLFSEELAALGIAKEICNRVIEPFVMCRGVITSTHWENFFNLRCHKDAQYEFQVLAKSMESAMLSSSPVERQLHLPYISDIDQAHNWDKNETINKIKISVARCARVSYKSFDGNETRWEQDLSLYNKLVVSRPVHASPAEHQVLHPSTAEWIAAELSKEGHLSDRVKVMSCPVGSIPGINGNFHPNVVQYRKLIEEYFDK
jgi:thymidylate synthase ThyX